MSELCKKQNFDFSFYMIVRLFLLQAPNSKVGRPPDQKIMGTMFKSWSLAGLSLLHFMIWCPKQILKLRQVESLPSRKSWDVDPWGQMIIKGKECISHTGVIIRSPVSYSSVGSWAPDSGGPGFESKSGLSLFLQFHCTYCNSLVVISFILLKSNVKEKYTCIHYVKMIQMESVNIPPASEFLSISY